MANIMINQIDNLRCKCCFADETVNQSSRVIRTIYKGVHYEKEF